MNLAQVYRDAADLIEKGGKVDEIFFLETKKGCRYCAVGAISMAIYGDPCRTHREPVEPLARKIGISDDDPSVDDFWGPIFDWSDSNSARTVIKTLREIADELS